MELMKIPTGETRSYKEVAEAIGHPNSSRAVANACASNPHPVIIPCHRVIRSDGGLGGYSGGGGMETKLGLLNSEGES
jgi:methylated-DNA-[protein]-cysteine S-methyltransferase